MFASRFDSLARRLRQLFTERHFWIIVAIFGILTLLHYLRLPFSLLPDGLLQRHAVERIIFLLPVAGATFVFGQTGGLITLALALLIMLPRVLWLSAYPGDAVLETAAVGVVGYLVTWMITTQEKEKRLRQEAVSRLRTINAIGINVSRSLDLEQILNSALDKVLEVNQVTIGYVYLVERNTSNLVLTAFRGVSPEIAKEFKHVRFDECLCGWVAQTAKPCVVSDLLTEKAPLRSLAREAGMRAIVAIPLMARDRAVGVLNLADPRPNRFAAQDVECMTSVGTGIGIAIENAHLYQSMRYYAQQITRAQENERARIARELHDDTIQSLIVLSRQLEMLAQPEEEMSPDRAKRLRELGKIADDVIRGVRRFSRDLRPSTLDDLGLLPTLEGLAASLTENDGIIAGLSVTGKQRRLPPEVDLVLFRIAQEALNNVKKHAQATQAMITVEFSPSTITMTVQDDGKGFANVTHAEDLAASGHLGLIGMHERARLLGGKLVIESRPNLGTKVVVTVPDAPPADHEDAQEAR